MPQNILVKSRPEHVWLSNGEPLKQLPTAQDKVTYRHELEKPHFLSFKNGVCALIVPCLYEIAEGDSLRNEDGWEGMVVEILERRRASGTWSDSPDWIKLRYV